MKNPHFVCRPDNYQPSGDDSALDLLRSTGSNTGNMLFISALRRVIEYPRDGRNTPKVGFNPAKVRNENDGLIIPAANWMNNHTDWGDLARLIEASGLRCVMVGLGAQSSDFGIYPKLTEGTHRLLKVVSERSHSISVRGEFSADVLRRYGIQNVVVTGCPSLLWHVDRAACVHSERSKPVRKVSVFSSRENGVQALQDDNLRANLSLLISQEARRRCYDHVAQTEIPDICFAVDRFADELPFEEAVEYATVAYGDSDKGALLEFLRRHMKVFFHAPEWIEYLGTRDFALGTRLHGVIASLLAGTPAALITHDTRTVEMARQACLPNVPGEEVLRWGSLNVQQIHDAIDLCGFNKRMRSYYRTFKQFFEANEVDNFLVDLPDSRSRAAAV